MTDPPKLPKNTQPQNNKPTKSAKDQARTRQSLCFPPISLVNPAHQYTPCPPPPAEPAPTQPPPPQKKPVENKGEKKSSTMKESNSTENASGDANSLNTQQLLPLKTVKKTGNININTNHTYGVTGLMQRFPAVLTKSDPVFPMKMSLRGDQLYPSVSPALMLMWTHQGRQRYMKNRPLTASSPLPPVHNQLSVSQAVHYRPPVDLPAITETQQEESLPRMLSKLPLKLPMIKATKQEQTAQKVLTWQCCRQEDTSVDGAEQDSQQTTKTPSVSELIEPQQLQSCSTYQPPEAKKDRLLGMLPHLPSLTRRKQQQQQQQQQQQDEKPKANRSRLASALKFSTNAKEARTSQEQRLLPILQCQKTQLVRGKEKRQISNLPNMEAQVKLDFWVPRLSVPTTGNDELEAEERMVGIGGSPFQTHPQKAPPVLLPVNSQPKLKTSPAGAKTAQPKKNPKKSALTKKSQFPQITPWSQSPMMEGDLEKERRQEKGPGEKRKKVDWEDLLVKEMAGHVNVALMPQAEISDDDSLPDNREKTEEEKKMEMKIMKEEEEKEREEMTQKEELEDQEEKMKEKMEEKMHLEIEEEAEENGEEMNGEEEDFREEEEENADVIPCIASL